MKGQRNSCAQDWVKILIHIRFNINPKTRIQAHYTEISVCNGNNTVGLVLTSVLNMKVDKPTILPSLTAKVRISEDLI